jgi:ABC-2 type transport system permease protein
MRLAEGDMHKLWQITLRELSAFFSTWMGYLIVAAALVIDGLLFNSFAVGNEPKLSAEVLADFFYFASGMSMVSGIFLAMRLMAEERQSGSIALLYSSPISERQVVYGKFLSAFLFSLVLHAASLYMPALVMVHGKISLGHVVAGYLCLALLSGATIAITLFASTLAPNQLIAAVGGAFVTVVLLTLWMVAKVVDQPFKDLFSWLAIHSDHFTPFSQGVINLRDVVFYLGLTVFFLECSARALEGRRCQG